MAARRFKGSWWVDFSFRGRRYRLRSPDNHRDGALEYEHTIRRQLSEGKPIYLSRDPRRIGEAPPTLEGFAAEWFKTYAMPRLKPSTLRNYVQRYEHHLQPAIGKIAIDTISARVFDRLAASLLGKGLHPKSVNNVLGVLRRMLMSAVEWGHLPALPLVKWLKTPPARFDFLSPLEADALSRATTRAPWHLMVLSALHTGLRLGELVALRWADIDLERGQLCVRRSCTRGIETSPKNNRIRFVPLTTELRQAFERVPTAERGEHVFEVLGTPVTQAMAWRALQTACKRAGLRHVGWHVLRHTFASHLVSENVPLVAVQALLGHSDIKMTQRYAHVAPSLLRSSVEQLIYARERARLAQCQPDANHHEQKANLEATTIGVSLALPPI